MTSECRCGRPTRDAAFVCDQCSKSLSVALGEIPWLEVELEVSLAGVKGVDYRTKGGTRASEKPSPANWAVSEAGANLRALLVSWTKFCVEERVRHSSPHQGWPADTMVSMSRWLLWRVDGLALLDIGPEAHDEITGAVRTCVRLIDRRAEQVYVGQCGAGDCPTDLYARIGARMIVCPTCAVEHNVEERRAWLLKQAWDVLATAAELSRAVSWLGKEPLTADRVRQWADRGRLSVLGHDRFGHSLYRVGDAIDLLSGVEPTRPISA